MVEQGKIDANDKVVCYVTGNGLKATESIMEVLQKPKVMKADVGEITPSICQSSYRLQGSRSTKIAPRLLGHSSCTISL